MGNVFTLNAGRRDTCFYSCTREATCKCSICEKVSSTRNPPHSASRQSYSNGQWGWAAEDRPHIYEAKILAQARQSADHHKTPCTISMLWSGSVLVGHIAHTWSPGGWGDKKPEMDLGITC